MTDPFQVAGKSVIVTGGGNGIGAVIAREFAIRGAKVGAQVKRKYIDDGVLFDDGADNAWGGLYEGGA